MSRNSSPSHSRRDSANSFSNPSSNTNHTFRPRPSGVPSSSGGTGTGTGGSRLNPSRGPSPAFQVAPSPTPSGPALPPRNIGLLLGCTVKLKLVGAGPNLPERWVEGQVWCYDPLPGVVVLECAGSEGAGKGRQTYRMVKMNQVRDVQVLKTSTMEDTSAAAIVAKVLEPVKPINIHALEMRETAVLKSEDARRARIGHGVSRWAQEIFDALGKTLPVRWAQTSIVILDDVLLPGPRYRPEDAKAENKNRLARVQHVLVGEWARLLRTEEGKQMELEAEKAAEAASTVSKASTTTAS